MDVRAVVEYLVPGESKRKHFNRRERKGFAKAAEEYRSGSTQYLLPGKSKRKHFDRQERKGLAKAAEEYRLALRFLLVPGTGYSLLATRYFDIILGQ